MLASKFSNRGYTLIELLMAMALFSGMLLIIALGFLYAIRLYRNGLSSRDSQANTSFGMDEMLRDTRAAYAAGVTHSGTTPPLDQLCLRLAGRDVVYMLTGIAHKLVLTRYNATATGPSNALTCGALNSPQTISSPSIILSTFGVSINTPPTPLPSPAPPTNNGIISITITLKGVAATGNADASGNCIGSDITNGFCANTTLVSTASLRGSQEVQ